jgi:hypothetical protein
VAAVITLVWAYRAAGLPQGCGPLGSYSARSATVRSALVWLGEADPVLSMDVMREEDPGLAIIGELIANWRDHLFPGSPYTAVEVEEVARERHSTGDYARSGFRDLLMRTHGWGKPLPLGCSVTARLMETDRFQAPSAAQRFTEHVGKLLGPMRIGFGPPAWADAISASENSTTPAVWPHWAPSRTSGPARAGDPA